MRALYILPLTALLLSCQEQNESTAVPTGSLRYLDAQDGWQGYRFTQKLSSQPHLRVAEGHPSSGLVDYSPPADSLTVAGIKLDKVRYTYFKDRLVKINFASADPTVAAQMEGLFTQLYGPGQADTVLEGHYTWQGQKVRAAALRQVLYDNMAHFTLEDSYFQDSMMVYGADTAGFHRAHPHGRAVVSSPTR